MHQLFEKMKRTTIAVLQFPGGLTMSRTEKETLMALARKYIWWKTAEEAVEFPYRVFAQVMNSGSKNQN